MAPVNGLDATALLSGLRGRRLCLELATVLDDDVRAASARAAYALDPGAGTSRVMLSAPGAGVSPPLRASTSDAVDTVAPYGRA